MNTTTEPTPAKRRRSAPVLWGSGALAAAVLVLGVSGTLSSWTSAILTNGDNHAGTTGAVALQETGPDGTGAAFTCTTATSTDNTASCDQINKYGNGGVEDTTLQPGDSISTSVTLKNTGSGDATTFTMAPGTCSSVYNTGSQLGATPAAGDDLCTELQVAVACTGDATLTVAATNLAAFATTHTLATGLPSGGSTTCTFTVSLPADAPSRFSGQTATQPIVWTLSA